MGVKCGVVPVCTLRRRNMTVAVFSRDEYSNIEI